MFWTIELCTHAKLNCLKVNYLHKNGFGIKEPTKVDMPTNQPTNQETTTQKNVNINIQ